jgi:hypothetical protein
MRLAATYDVRNLTRVSSRQHGPRRCMVAFNPQLSHAAVYGDPMAPAIELQLLHASKFAFLEGHMAQVGACMALRLRDAGGRMHGAPSIRVGIDSGPGPTSELAA